MLEHQSSGDGTVGKHIKPDDESLRPGCGTEVPAEAGPPGQLASFRHKTQSPDQIEVCKAHLWKSISRLWLDPQTR